MDFTFNICYAMWLRGIESIVLNWKLTVLNWHLYYKKNTVIFPENFDMLSYVDTPVSPMRVSVFLFSCFCFVTGDISMDLWCLFSTWNHSTLRLHWMLWKLSKSSDNNFVIRWGISSWKQWNFRRQYGIFTKQNPKLKQNDTSNPPKKTPPNNNNET